MPGGKRGDHPLTDILHYGSSEFGEDIDSLVRRMVGRLGFAAVRDEVAMVLLQNSPMFRHSEAKELCAVTLERLKVIESQLPRN